MWKSIAGVMIAGLCLAMVSVIFAAEIAEASIPQDATGTTPVYTGVDALLSLYDERANAVLPILPPDESGSVRQVIDFGRVTIDEMADGYSESFLASLSTKGVYNADYDVITYPILILLDERTHDYILSAHDGTELLRLERPKDYDPLWYTIAYFKQRDLQPARQAFKDHARMYNPARIVGLMELVTVEGALAIAKADALVAEPLLSSLPEILRAGGPYVDSLSVEGMALNTPTNGAITLTIGYPSGMQGVPLDLIGCDDLMAWNWSVLASTNAPSGTNQFSYVISPIATNRSFVTVYRTDLPAGDTDGDGVPNGEENSSMALIRIIQTIRRISPERLPMGARFILGRLLSSGYTDSHHNITRSRFQHLGLISSPRWPLITTIYSLMLIRIPIPIREDMNHTTF
jgi:hypothetical protein